MRIVLDTNVIVSGLLSPDGPTGEIVRLVAAADLALCYDVRIISEYRNVLLRQKFSFQSDYVEYFLDQVKSAGFNVAGKPLASRLPDKFDEPFLEVAIAGKVSYLVTGNIRHYPKELRQGIRVVLPGEFLEVCRRKMT